MSNKYIASVGKEKQLRGPVEMEKPGSPQSVAGNKNEWEWDEYETYLASLPIAFTNVSWLTEEDNGKILEEGKDFEIVNQLFVQNEWSNVTPKGFTITDSSSCRSITVPIKDKQPERMFTLKEMIAAMMEGGVIEEEPDVTKRKKLRQKYFKQKFNIDISKTNIVSPI